jgi:hypothetical protein
MKTIPLVNHFYLLLNHNQENKYREDILEITKVIYEMFSFYPESILPDIKNMPLYIEYLDNLKSIMTFFTFIFKKNFTYEVIENIDKILGL